MIARTFPFGISSALTWLAACSQSLKQSPFTCQRMHIFVFPDGPSQEGFSLVCLPTKFFFQSSSSFIFSSGCCESFEMCLLPSSLGFGFRFFLYPSSCPDVSFASSTDVVLGGSSMLKLPNLTPWIKSPMSRILSSTSSLRLASLQR